MSADLLAKKQLADAFDKEGWKLYSRSKRWWYSAARRTAIDALYRDALARQSKLKDEIRKLQEPSA